MTTYSWFRDILHTFSVCRRGRGGRVSTDWVLTGYGELAVMLIVSWTGKLDDHCPRLRMRILVASPVNFGCCSPPHPGWVGCLLTDHHYSPVPLSSTVSTRPIMCHWVGSEFIRSRNCCILMMAFTTECPLAYGARYLPGLARSTGAAHSGID